MLEGKCEENRVPKDVELTPQKKIKMSKSETKKMKKKPREMENSKKKWKEWEMNEKTMKNDLS